MTFRNQCTQLYSTYYMKSRLIIDSLNLKAKYILVSPDEVSQRDSILLDYISQLGFSYEQLIDTYAFSRAANEISVEAETIEMRDHWMYTIRNREVATLLSRIESHLDYIAFIVNEILSYHNENMDIKNPKKVNFYVIFDRLLKVKAVSKYCISDIDKLKDIPKMLNENSAMFKSLRNINTHRYLVAIDHIGIEANRKGFKASDNRAISHSICLEGDEIDYYSNHEIKFEELEDFALEMIKKFYLIEEKLVTTFAYSGIVDIIT